MIDKTQIKGLEKLVNSDIIKNIYPVIGKIGVNYFEKEYWMFKDYLIFDFYLNDPEANKDNYWDKFQLDQYYLIDNHIRNLFPYLGIYNDKTGVRYRIFDTDFNIIDSNNGDLNVNF